MNIFEKIISGMKPKEIDTVNPAHELYEDFKGHWKGVLGTFITCLLLSSFLTGLFYQMVIGMFDKKKKIYLFSSFEYGFSKMIILTLLLLFIMLFTCFKLYRSVKKNYVKNYKENYYKSTSETFGSAHWQTEDELKENFNIHKSIEDTTDEVFGRDSAGNIYTLIYKGGMNKNKIFHGAPGSGKTSAIVKTDIYQSIRRGDSYICTDSKGTLYNQTAAVAQECGYTVRILNLKPSEFKNSDGVNVFATLHPDDPAMDAKADVIANSIIKNTSASAKLVEEYWGSNEFNLIKCVAMYVCSNEAEIKAGHNNLPGLYNFITTHTATDLAAIFRNIPETSPIKQAYNIFANCSAQNQGQIINGASIRLSKLSNNYLQKVLSIDDIDSVLPMKKKCAYYIVMAEDNTYGFISSIFFSTMFNDQCDYSDKLSEKQKEKQLSVNYIMDEYANTGGIQGLPSRISTVRSRKIGLSLFLQDVGQLLTMYTESEVSTILNCCIVKGLLSTNDLTTAKYYADLLGTQTAVSRTTQTQEATSDTIHAHFVEGVRFSEGSRALMLPEDFINGKLERDEIVYVIGGMPPVKLKKYFSELNGEAIHPLEKRSVEIGFRNCSRRLPRWRKALKEEEERKKQLLRKMEKKESPDNNGIASFVFYEEESASAQTSVGNTDMALPSGKRTKQQNPSSPALPAKGAKTYYTEIPATGLDAELDVL